MIKYIKSFVDSFNGKGLNLYLQSEKSFLENHIFVSCSKDLFEIGLVNEDESIGNSILIGKHSGDGKWFVE